MKCFAVFFAVVILLLSSEFAASQTFQDVVYLKNGSMIKGMIIEQIPGQSLKIQTSDGSVFVYSMDEVVKITKEAAQQSNAQGSANPKSPVLSFVLSWLLPGVGQFYNGDTGKGFIQLVGAAAGWTAFFVAYPGEGYESYTYWDAWNEEYVTRYDYPETGNGTISNIGLGVAIACHLWSMIDAPISATKKNKKIGYTFNEIKINENMTLTFIPIDKQNKDVLPMFSLKYNF